MKKKIEILGLEIDNYSVREAILLVEGYLNNTSINIIETISTRMLSDAEHMQIVRQAISEADLTVIGEKEILVAAGIVTPQRLKETKEQEFFREFMKRIVRNHKRLYILAEEQSKIEKFDKILREEYPKYIMAGGAALNECSGDFENIINVLNGETADVVISLIPSPRQEEFILNYKDKMSAKIWYSLGNYAGDSRSALKKSLKKIFHKHALIKKIGYYRNENEEEK